MQIWWTKCDSHGGIMINVYDCKKWHVCEKDYIWNPATCRYKNGKYLASIMDDLAVTCEGNIDMDAEAKLNDKETKIFPTNWKKYNLKNIKFLYFTNLFQ